MDLKQKIVANKIIVSNENKRILAKLRNLICIKTTKANTHPIGQITVQCQQYRHYHHHQQRPRRLFCWLYYWLWTSVCRMSQSKTLKAAFLTDAWPLGKNKYAPLLSDAAIVPYCMNLICTVSKWPPSTDISVSNPSSPSKTASKYLFLMVIWLSVPWLILNLVLNDVYIISIFWEEVRLSFSNDTFKGYVRYLTFTKREPLILKMFFNSPKNLFSLLRHNFSKFSFFFSKFFHSSGSWKMQ